LWQGEGPSLALQACGQPARVAHILVRCPGGSFFYNQGGFGMATAQPVAVGNVVCGPGRPLTWIAGPCVIESHDLTLRIADRLRELADRLRLPLVFKAS